jgi:glycosyltransferase involved in cell wall biosynthesis
MNPLYRSNSIAKADILCFSHLRWDFVYQRPQHLMSRFARKRRVFFIEEPIRHDGDAGWLFTQVEDNVVRCVPKIPESTEGTPESAVMRSLLNSLTEKYESLASIHWFYTPMMMSWVADREPIATVYDCMDELSKFKFAPGGIVDLERQLFAKADLVFTGGHSLYKAKRDQHPAVHEFPSSIDAPHFRQALFEHEVMQDQLEIARPRIGYAGVIDERIDLDLIAAAADLRPEWAFVLLGPVVKIDEASLPRRSNIHYLGMKDYADLPRYFAGWDLGMMPFALNESTEFISPTKTPEYLASGLPVVSTAIADVVHPYGKMGIVRIATNAEEFVNCAELGMAEDNVERLRKVDLFLADRSWDRTCNEMNTLINATANKAKPVYSEGNAAIGRATAVNFAT